MTKKLFLVQQPRVRHVTYERKIWADNEQDAIRIGTNGTAWPESYDERTESVDEGEVTATEITDPHLLKAWESHR